jgi:ATP-binding cassette subfamily B protein
MQILQIIIEPLQSGGSLDAGRLAMYLGLGVLAAVLYAVAYSIEYDKTYTTSYKESAAVRIEVAEHMRKLPLSFFNKKDLSELTANMMADCATIEGVLSHVLPQLAANCVSVTLICVILAVYDWRMALAMFCTLPVAAAVIVASKKLQSKLGGRHSAAKLDASDKMQEYLEGIKVVKSFGLAGEKSARLKDSLNRMMKEAIAFEAAVGSLITLASMIVQVGCGVVILVGVNLLTGNSLGVIAFLIFTLLSVKIYGPFLSILALFSELMYFMIATKRIRRLREEKPMTGDENAELNDYTVEIKNVSFAYNDATENPASIHKNAATARNASTKTSLSISQNEKNPHNDVIKNLTITIPQNEKTPTAVKNTSLEIPQSEKNPHNDVIKNLTITIPQNSVTAFVGPSGSGKTTVSRLIARFWDVREGEILIGGRNIREIDPERLMKYMSFVFQDVVLFNDTVMNNIRIGKKDASDDEILAAARLARCDEFIREMPQGYETVIGENGSTLSGGERQRISIARALLKNAPIVLLDEATASLDPENETQIQAALSELIRGKTTSDKSTANLKNQTQAALPELIRGTTTSDETTANPKNQTQAALSELVKDKTVIVIAHRLRTVIGADKIVVLDDGKLVEEGTSEALLSKNNLFAKLYKIQQESLSQTVGSKRIQSENPDQTIAPNRPVL